jgi:predicted HNH restriction endonuclease
MSAFNYVFKQVGVTLKNPRWSWSGRDADGKVWMTFWRHGLHDGQYALGGHKGGKKHPGRNAMIADLKHALATNNGIVGGVLITAADPHAKPRKVVRAERMGNMRITSLDELTGSFTAEDAPDRDDVDLTDAERRECEHHFDEDFGHAEGEQAERLQKYRKRFPGFARKHKKWLAANGLLRCDLGQCDPSQHPLLHGLDVDPHSLFDVHHKNPLQQGARETRREDVQLLCPTCHRITHAMMAARKGVPMKRRYKITWFHFDPDDDEKIVSGPGRLP